MWRWYRAAVTMGVVWLGLGRKVKYFFRLFGSIGSGRTWCPFRSTCSVQLEIEEAGEATISNGLGRLDDCCERPD